MTNLENQEHAIDFNNRPNAKLYDKSVTKTNKTVQQLNYLMGILHGHPTHVSHLINQTEPHLQFDQSYIYHRKKKEKDGDKNQHFCMPSITVAKERRNSKINNLTLKQLTQSASPEMYYYTIMEQIFLSISRKSDFTPQSNSKKGT